MFQTYVIELGPYKQGNFAPRSSYDHIQYYDDTDRYDFPVSIQVCTVDDLRVVYVHHANSLKSNLHVVAGVDPVWNGSVISGVQAQLSL